MLSPCAQALDLSAGDYDPAPVGMTVANLYLDNGLYNRLYNGSHLVPGTNKLHTQIGIVSLQHYVDIGGVLAVPIVIVPFGQISETVMGNTLGNDKGLFDIIIAMPFWAYNDTKTHTYLAVAPFLYLPTGSYDSHHAVNLGDNRYRGTLQLAFSTHLNPQIAWDIAADATVYGDNTDAVGGGTRSQNLGYELQTNARYYFSTGNDIRAGISYTDAGATKQNGVTTESYSISKYWMGTAFWLSRSTQMALTVHKDFKVQNGFKDDSQIKMRVIQIF